MMIKRCLTVLALMASCAVFSYAQTDGGIGGHAPARSQLVTSNNFSLTAVPCTGSPLPADCAAFPAGVQEIFSFYNQSGTPFDALTIHLKFDTVGLPAGEEVGCLPANIEPTWTIANCIAGVPIDPSTGDVTLTFQQGTGGEGVGCYNANTSGTDLVTSGNQACLSNSVNNFVTDLSTGGAAQLPYVNFTQAPPPTQTSGACTVPPNDGFPINDVLPWLVCGQDSSGTRYRSRSGRTRIWLRPIYGYAPIHRGCIRKYPRASNAAAGWGGNVGHVAALHKKKAHA